MYLLAETSNPFLQMSYWEIAMLVCFGAGWPISVLKMWRTKVSLGKSSLFVGIVMVGYACGIVHKLLFDLDIVIALYIFNMAFVSIDLAMTIKYRHNLPQQAIGPPHFKTKTKSQSKASLAEEHAG